MGTQIKATKYDTPYVFTIGPLKKVPLILGNSRMIPGQFLNYAFLGSVRCPVQGRRRLMLSQKCWVPFPVLCSYYEDGMFLQTRVPPMIFKGLGFSIRLPC